ncbi:hypothetical protein [Paenibacillus planticolens]|uniref:Uncharacterized protein n=1 Tax=Paenibacillus planticolens TaxID=2654976 RepID=A0ABX1ZPQ3_9BACL|nr:hypothetical protein [Paenibacillus planticolens]NOV00995.1 hypothetical protein [Paenibacillus planticolens]
MTTKIVLAFACLLFLSALGVNATENESYIVRPYSPDHYDSTKQFEYEFEWQHGKIAANP